MKYFLLICLLLASCKVKKHSESNTTSEVQLERIELATRQIALQHEGDVETVQTWERLDTIGRVVERSTTRQQARSKSKATEQAQVEAKAEKAIKTTEQKSVQAETRGGFSPSITWLVFAFALGLIAGGYALYRLRK